MSGSTQQVCQDSGTRVLLVDDNPKLCRMVKEYLEPLGYDVTVAHTGPEGLEQVLRGSFQAVILDVMLPGLDGFAVLRLIRERSNVPVLMLTGRGEPPDRIAGLELGADDYVPKTYSPRELLARLRAVIRRSMLAATAEPRPKESAIILGDLRINAGSRTATMNGEPLMLTPTEFDLLWVLARDRGRVRSREELLLEVADRDFESFDRSIDVHISSLRKKLGDNPKSPRWIITVRSAGYLLQDGEAPQP